MTHKLRGPLLSFLVILCHIGAAIALACPTCDADPHSGKFLAGSFAGVPGAGPWDAEAAGCACCESSDCDGEELLPHARLQRSAPAVQPLLGSAFVLPAARPATTLRWTSNPRATGGSVRLHLQYASLLC